MWLRGMAATARHDDLELIRRRHDGARPDGELADRQGDKAAEAVDKLADTIDEKTGGGASTVTATVDGAVSGAIGIAQGAANAVAQKAGEAANAVKATIPKTPEST